MCVQMPRKEAEKAGITDIPIIARRVHRTKVCHIQVCIGFAQCRWSLLLPNAGLSMLLDACDAAPKACDI